MKDFQEALSAAFGLIAHGDAELLSIVALSLRVSMTAAVIACVIGAPLGALLAVTRFPGRTGVIVFVHAPVLGWQDVRLAPSTSPCRDWHRPLTAA